MVASDSDCGKPITARVVPAYRRALSTSQALKAIANGAGTQFDPDVARTFIALMSEAQAESWRQTGYVPPCARAENEKAPPQRGFLEVAGAGFEPATFGL